MSTSSPALPVPFRKGHGTGNDFVLLPDPQAALTLTPRLVRALCDRRFGIGADGVLRVVPSSQVPGVGSLAATSGAAWFMDYWNADGSLAEMCGNGARVFARHLVDAGAEQSGDFFIGTRGGTRAAHVPATGPISIDMGVATPLATEHDGVTVRLNGSSWPATGAFVPNPHAVAFVDDLAAIGDVSAAVVTPGTVFPDGVNIEFVEVQSDDHVAMRVLERGSGETLSCGTGACAVAWVHRHRHAPDAGPITVAVPGGELVVTEDPGGSITLAGPTQLVAEGVIDADWWRSVA